MPNQDVTVTKLAKELNIGDKFRIGGWIATIADIMNVNPHSGVDRIFVFFEVDGSVKQYGSFDTPLEGPFELVESVGNEIW